MRERHLTFLGGCQSRVAGRLNVTWLGGVTYATTHLHYRSPGSGLLEDLSFNESGLAWTFGADVAAPLTSRMALVIPLRFTPTLDIYGHHNGLGMKAGVGVAYTYRRQAM